MLKRGDQVRIRRDRSDEWCEGYVAFANENGLAVGVMLSGMVRAGNGYIAGALALTIDPEAETLTGLTGDEYEVEVKTEMHDR